MFELIKGEMAYVKDLESLDAVSADRSFVGELLRHTLLDIRAAAPFDGTSRHCS